MKTFTSQNFLFSRFSLDDKSFLRTYIYLNKAILLIFDNFLLSLAI